MTYMQRKNYIAYITSRLEARDAKVVRAAGRGASVAQILATFDLTVEQLRAIFILAAEIGQTW